MKSSLAQIDYSVNQPAERPVIKKLVDNLQVSSGQLEANSSLRTDYPELPVARPVLRRLVDQIKTSSAEFAAASVSQVISLIALDRWKSFTYHYRTLGGIQAVQRKAARRWSKAAFVVKSTRGIGRRFGQSEWISRPRELRPPNCESYSRQNQIGRSSWRSIGCGHGGSLRF